MFISKQRGQLASARLISALALLFCLAVVESVAHAQARQPSRAEPAVDATASPPCKIAVINTDAFTDERTGIKRIVQTLKKSELDARRRELEIADLQQRINQLSNELNESSRTGEAQTEQETRQKREQLDQLRNDLQSKTAENQSAASSLKRERPAPLDDEIQRAMIAFARSRGFTILLEQARDKTSVIWAIETIDLTKDFIRDFNSKFPANDTGELKP